MLAYIYARLLGDKRHNIIVVIEVPDFKAFIAVLLMPCSLGVLTIRQGAYGISVNSWPLEKICMHALKVLF